MMHPRLDIVNRLLQLCGLWSGLTAGEPLMPRSIADGVSHPKPQSVPATQNQSTLLSSHSTHIGTVVIWVVVLLLAFVVLFAMVYFLGSVARNWFRKAVESDVSCAEHKFIRLDTADSEDQYGPPSLSMRPARPPQPVQLRVVASLPPLNTKCRRQGDVRGGTSQGARVLDLGGRRFASV